MVHGQRPKSTAEVFQGGDQRRGVTVAEPLGLQGGELLLQGLNRNRDQQQALLRGGATQGTLVAALPDPNQEIQGLLTPHLAGVRACRQGLTQGLALQGHRPLAALLQQGQHDQIGGIGHRSAGAATAPP